MRAHTHSTHTHNRTRTWRDIRIQNETNSHIYMRRIRLGPQSRRSVRVHFHGRISYLPTIILISLEAVFSWLVVVICHSRGFDVIVTLLYCAVYWYVLYEKPTICPRPFHSCFINVLCTNLDRFCGGSLDPLANPSQFIRLISLVLSYFYFYIKC